MKFAPLLFAFAAAALAQDPAPEKPAPAKPARPELKPTPLDPKPVELQPLQPASPDIPPLPERTEEPSSRPPQVLPDSVPPGKKPALGTVSERPRGRTTLKPPATAIDLDLRIRFRNAQNKAAGEPAIAALWEESRTAATDFAKREALKNYYDKLYRRMVSLDKAITPIVEDRKLYNLRRLEQTRIAPTDPLDDEERIWRN